MPPETRRSQVGSQANAVKRVSRKRAPPAVNRKDASSWSFLDTRNDDDHVLLSTEEQDRDDDGEHEDEDEDEGHIVLDGPAHVDAAVTPLRETADRVGQEVEQFAACLDKFLKVLPEREDKLVAATEVVGKFQQIAEVAALRLQDRHDKERMVQLRKEWAQRAEMPDQRGSLRLSATSVLEGRRANEVKELRQWQQEADLWALFKLTLELHCRPGPTATAAREREKEREKKLAELGQPHRYTTEAELYERCLIADDFARERALVKKWLEETADHQEADLSGVMEELELRSGAGKGLWSKGWLQTRERIKKEKRLRSWPSPSDSSVLPQIRTDSGEEMLVTTLDPDAPNRQQRALEKEDRFYEKAVWVACWEMLRRGKPWEEIKIWCEERNEGWRAAALFAMDNKTASSHGAWRKMCYLASESTCANEYEAAVYGLVSGNMKAVEKVCKSFDDYLYAYYSTTLTRHFESYLQREFPHRVPALGVRHASTDHSFGDVNNAREKFKSLVKRLREGATKEEAGKPLKLIQAFLLDNDAGGLVFNTGLAASDLDSMRGGDENTIERVRPPPAQLSPEAQIVLDPQALRIAAHIYIVTRALDAGAPTEETAGAEENVLVSYLQALRARGQRDYAPMYASQLQYARYVIVMASYLQDVSGSREQHDLLSLMQTNFRMDVVAILSEQVSYIVSHHFTVLAPPDRPLQVVEECEEDSLYPGRRIREDFMPDGWDEGDMLLARSLDWFRLLHGEWKVTFANLGLALRKALVAGHVGCAMMIARKFPFSNLSESKAGAVLGKPVNIMDRGAPQPAQGSEEAIRWEVLRRQARTYYELEQLVHAILALADWVAVERTYTTNPRPLAASAPPLELKGAKGALDEAMVPLLQPSFLREATDDAEAIDLRWLRRTYLPEIIIAYNTALFTAGPIISRDAYIESMDLSNAIADEGSGLADAFVQAGRMRELVGTFALASKMMLVMKEAGKKRKANKEGKELGMWEIGPQGQGALQGVVGGAADAEVP